MKHFWEHLMIDLYWVRDEKTEPKDNFVSLFDKLVEKCEMNKLGESVSYVVDELENSERDFWGITAFQVVKESHISIHTFKWIWFVSMDIYTCKSLPEFDIIDIVKSYFETDDVEVRFVKRWLRYERALKKFLEQKK